jgi:hypothetical protein
MFLIIILPIVLFARMFMERQNFLPNSDAWAKRSFRNHENVIEPHATPSQDNE